jgi:hypothetical protein
MEWIRCTDRIPPCYGYYLVYAPDADGVQFELWEDGGWDNYQHNEITHWMPLPEPPAAK